MIHTARRYVARTRDGLVFCGALLFVCALRFQAFFRSVIDWDESIFLLMGRDWLRGHVPYTTTWEWSPPGAAGLFAAGQAVCGETVFAIRILTVLAVAVECYLLYRLGRGLGGGDGAGLAAALAYAVYSLNNTGLAAHRELFFAPCITLAYLWLFGGMQEQATAGQISTVRLFGAGLALGAGLQLKYLYVIDLAGVGIAVGGWLLYRHRRMPRRAVVEVLRAGAALAAGPLILIAVAALLFAAHGLWTDYVHANFVAGAGYVTGQAFDWTTLGSRLTGQVRANPLPWLGLLLAPLVLRGHGQRRSILLLGVWLLFALLDAIFSRRLFAHYFLQLLPPLCLLLGLTTAGALRSAGPARRLWRLSAVAIIFAACLFPITFYRLTANAGLVWHHLVNDRPWPVDTPARVSDYLRQRISAADSIYVADYEPVVYYLTDARLPTRYVFPLHLTEPTYSAAGGLDPRAELRLIMAQRPLYVIRRASDRLYLRDAALAADLDRYLEEDYLLETTIRGEDYHPIRHVTVALYRRKASWAFTPATRILTTARGDPIVGMTGGFGTPFTR
jgi:4-amino-4-deoxy-L-arabinose transferase-like glycosyltransferase